MIQLSDHFDFRKLLRYTFPSIVMLIFTSIYSVVDGFFVSNFVGKTPFAALNLVYPIVMLLGSLGFMFGTGGSALIAKTMGQNQLQKANEIFSLLIWVSLACGVVLGVLGTVFLRPIALFLGAEGELLEQSLIYGRIVLMAVPTYILQYEFQCLFSVAENPKLGLYFTLIAGLTNMVLDALFVMAFSWGLAGAAAATSLSQCVGGLLPLIYFARKNPSPLRLVRPKWDGRALAKVCSNGISELLSNVSMSLVGVLYNFQLLHYAGEDGVAAYGVLLYVGFIFLSIFIGYSVGVAPVISYHYGAGYRSELQSLFRKSLAVISVFALAMFGAALCLARPLANLFVGYDPDLLRMTTRGLQILSFSFLFIGYATFSSAFFTALNDGKVSACISSLRALVFQVCSVLILPLFWGLDGIWASNVAAEWLAVVAAAGFLLCNRKKYGYI